MNGITTSKLLTMIRGAQTFEEATAYHRTAPQPVFHQLLFDMMQKREMSPKDMIRVTCIDRSYFYHILNGQKSPGRNIVLRIGFCLRVTLNEMNHLLLLAGLAPLYAKVRRDALLIYAIQKKLTMDQANDLLADAGEVPLYWKDKDE